MMSIFLSLSLSLSHFFLTKLEFESPYMNLF